MWREPVWRCWMSERPGIIGGRDHFHDFDLDSPEFRDHYDEVLGELVEKCPVARSEAFGGYWVVSRADDLRRCALEYTTFTTTQGFEPNRSNEEGGLKLIPLEIDPPYHTRWRNALGPSLSPRGIQDKRESIRLHANYLIDGFIERGQCEFVGEFAAPLPGRVFFGSFLGVPFSELADIQKATDDAMRGPVEGRAAGWQTVAEFLTNYLRMRENEPPRGDFVDAVLAGVNADDGQPCPWEHKLYCMIDMLAGGMGTTQHVLAGMVLHLATHPDDATRLRDDPALRPNAIEEIIRFYAPIVAVGRTATQDTEIAGQQIAKGDFVMLAQAAACRDPQMYENPNQVVIERKLPINLAFSWGPHRCIGAHVGRLEVLVALDEILRRLPDLRVAEGFVPTYTNSSVARNMEDLQVVFTPGTQEGVTE
jgi:cytochrome P450